MESKDVSFEYIEEFVDCVIDEVENDDNNFVTIIAKFNKAKEILKEIMTYGNINFESLQIESPYMDNYYDEFILSLWMNDGVIEVGCEKLKDEDGNYTNPCGDVVFLFDDCSSKIIPLCEGSNLYFVNIMDDNDRGKDCDCECLCDCHNGDKDIASASSYTINGRSVSKEEFDKKHTELQKRYEKNCKDLLLKHCEFMDIFNEFLKF